MSSSRRRGVRPPVCSHACIAVLGAALSAGGCATEKSPPHQASGVAPAVKSLATGPDDPSEPWSPSYGSRPIIKDVAPSRMPAPVEAGTTRVAVMDPDAVIRRAVAEHEMRKP